MLKGRLGLATARIPQVDRHGLLWLGRGRLFVEDGTLRFVTAGTEEMLAGDYAIPFQMLTGILIQPGTTVSHDALRLLARHGTGLVAVAEGGVRFYASMPFGPDDSARARRQAILWADEESRLHTARRMYAWRLGEVFPDAQIEVLRGMEGARVKETYRRLAERFGVQWRHRRYDRDRPDWADLPNQALNHASSAVYAAAEVAVAVTGTIPQLGFIHEDSGIAFALDIADLFRDSVTVPIAFSAAKSFMAERLHGETTVERHVRQHAGRLLRREQVIGKMIDRIKELLDADDRGGDA
ncbi:MAG: type I-E CRISPR-associated endonuclease Cas1e [Myxococcota bacterium]